MGAIVREFFIWWFGQLAALVPGSGDRARARKNSLLILSPEPPLPNGAQAVTARIDRRGRIEKLGRVVLDNDGMRSLKRWASSLGRSGETVIEMPASAMLEKRMVLPLAAERDLDRVIAYEMDRETPFGADEVFWGTDIEERDRRQRRMTLRLAMVAKAQVADLLAAVARAAVAPTALIGAGAGRPVVISLNRDAVRRRGWVGYAAPAMGWVAAILFIVAIVVPFVKQGMALDEVDDQIEAIRPTVQAVEKLRQHIAGDRQEADNLAAQRAQFGDPLAMLAAVTEALPDDTSLTELDYSMGKLTLTGQSKTAAHLISDLSAKPAFKDPTFSAPVTRVEQGKFDVFTISAQMRN